MGTTTIQKIVLDVDPADTMHDQFEVMGEIEWRVRIVDVPHQRLSNTVQWFPPSAWDLGTVCGILGNHLAESVVLMFAQRAPLSKRTFKGPDGRPYRWDLQFRVVLFRDGGAETEVARYHRGSPGIIEPKKQPFLDVDSGVTDMLDLIILTFVYVEKLRGDRERAIRHSWW
ncbi:hypothetical protein JVT61DRAFT_7195 [Boletus reticuloceps]|uniref:DUF6593 domain-containing protein n=1 Tax=Boletus reticuloceps TaxID=495285 RepID=A0A8I2YK94_9AGAM|nr:hypothetical protein JVT61DRAFT_7195 [Boletus reticuloceps]